MRAVSGTRGAAVAAIALIVVGAAALLYAPENKAAIKIAILAAGVVLGAVVWLRSRR